MENSYGKLTAVISTIRHGAKNDLGELTEDGARQALEKGLGIENLEGDIVLLHSGVERVRKTLTLTATSLQRIIYDENDKTQRMGTFKDYESHYLHYLFDPKVKSPYFVEWEKVNGDFTAEAERMRSFLRLGASSPEPEIFPSPKEMAVRLARVIATEIDFVTITIPEVRTNFINGSHEPVIMAFLYYFLQDFQPGAADFLDSINGTLGFAEGFEIQVFQNLIGENRVIFKFRDIEKDIDQKRLKDFCLSL